MFFLNCLLSRKKSKGQWSLEGMVLAADFTGSGTYGVVHCLFFIALTVDDYCDCSMGRCIFCMCACRMLNTSISSLHGDLDVDQIDTVMSRRRRNVSIKARYGIEVLAPVGIRVHWTGYAAWQLEKL